MPHFLCSHENLCGGKRNPTKNFFLSTFFDIYRRKICAEMTTSKERDKALQLVKRRGIHCIFGIK
jgi:hypothetical protein